MYVDIGALSVKIANPLTVHWLKFGSSSYRKDVSFYILGWEGRVATLVGLCMEVLIFPILRKDVCFYYFTFLALCLEGTANRDYILSFRRLQCKC